MDVLLQDTGFLDSSDAGICKPHHSESPQTWWRQLDWIRSSVSVTGVHQPCTPLEHIWTQPPRHHYPGSANVGGDVVHPLLEVWPYSQPLCIGSAPTAVEGTLTNCHVSSFLPPPTMPGNTSAYLRGLEQGYLFQTTMCLLPCLRQMLQVTQGERLPGYASRVRVQDDCKSTPTYTQVDPGHWKYILASMNTVVVFHSCIWSWTSDGCNLCLIIWIIWSHNNNYVGIIIV